MDFVLWVCVDAVVCGVLVLTPTGPAEALVTVMRGALEEGVMVRGEGAGLCALVLTCALELTGVLVLTGAGDVLFSARPAGRVKTGRVFLMSVCCRVVGEGGRL